MNPFESQFDDGAKLTPENAPLIEALVNYGWLMSKESKEISKSDKNLFLSACEAWHKKYPDYGEMFDMIGNLLATAAQNDQEIPQFAMHFYLDAIEEIVEMAGDL